MIFFLPLFNMLKFFFLIPNFPLLEHDIYAIA